MTATEFRELLAFEESLTVGQTVTLRWTNSHRDFQAQARVVKLNRASLIGELLEDAGFPGHSYPKEHHIRVPRFAVGTIGNRWSAYNGAFPAKETPALIAEQTKAGSQ